MIILTAAYIIILTIILIIFFTSEYKIKIRHPDELDKKVLYDDKCIFRYYENGRKNGLTWASLRSRYTVYPEFIVIAYFYPWKTHYFIITKKQIVSIKYKGSFHDERRICLRHTAYKEPFTFHSRRSTQFKKAIKQMT
jgi:hypothetical protein